MLRWEVGPLRSQVTTGRVEDALGEIVADLGFEVGSSGELRQYPGSRHWHIRQPRRAGTVEITFWPEELRLWVTVHRGREGSWAEEGSRWLAQELARALSTGYEQLLEEPS